MNNSKKLKAIVLSMGLGGGAMLASTSVQAQLIDQRGERPNARLRRKSAKKTKAIAPQCSEQMAFVL